jgi:hypothetical protein
MIWNEKLLFPPHEDSSPVSIIDREPGSFGLVFDVAKGREAGPVNEILIFAGAPVLRQKAMTTPDNFSIEIGC